MRVGLLNNNDVLNYTVTVTKEEFETIIERLLYFEGSV